MFQELGTSLLYLSNKTDDESYTLSYENLYPCRSFQISSIIKRTENHLDFQWVPNITANINNSELEKVLVWKKISLKKIALVVKVLGNRNLSYMKIIHFQPWLGLLLHCSKTWYWTFANLLRYLLYPGCSSCLVHESCG